jgi:hypothetical protein
VRHCSAAVGTVCCYCSNLQWVLHETSERELTGHDLCVVHSPHSDSMTSDKFCCLSMAIRPQILFENNGVVVSAV